MPRIKNYGKKGRGLQAVATISGKLAYKKGDRITELIGVLAPKDIYDDEWTVELRRSDLDDEPIVGQIHYKD